VTIKDSLVLTDGPAETHEVPDGEGFTEGLASADSGLEEISPAKRRSSAKKVTSTYAHHVPFDDTWKGASSYSS
jgi:hypothetical protein